jgi:hypothetical protein
VTAVTAPAELAPTHCGTIGEVRPIQSGPIADQLFVSPHLRIYPVRLVSWGLQQRAELMTGAWSEQGPIRFLCLFDLLFGLDITFTAIAKWAQQPTRANRQQAIGMVLEHTELRDDYRCRNVKQSSHSLP